MATRRRRRIPYTVVGLLFLLAFVFPLFWMLVTSIKDASAIASGGLEILPTRPTLDGWLRVLQSSSLPRYFLNSTIVAVGTTVLTLALACPAAYGLARFRLPGRGSLLSLCLIGLMFPSIVLALPLFAIFSRLGLTNTYLALILANTTVSLPFIIVMLRPLAAAIPGEIIEAARTDGCSHWGAYLRIGLPITIPSVFTAMIFAFLFGWSDFVFALSLINIDSMRPITAGLWLFVGEHTTDWPGLMAFATIAMLPPLAVFLFAQRHVVSGLASGAVR